MRLFTVVTKKTIETTLNFISNKVMDQKLDSCLRVEMNTFEGRLMYEAIKIDENDEHIKLRDDEDLVSYCHDSAHQYGGYVTNKITHE